MATKRTFKSLQLASRQMRVDRTNNYKMRVVCRKLRLLATVDILQVTLDINGRSDGICIYKSSTNFAFYRLKLGVRQGVFYAYNNNNVLIGCYTYVADVISQDHEYIVRYSDGSTGEYRAPGIHFKFRRFDNFMRTKYLLDKSPRISV